MTRLDPYLGQPLKEIAPNADAVLTCVSHGIPRYDTQPAAFYIAARCWGKENTAWSRRPICDHDGPLCVERLCGRMNSFMMSTRCTTAYDGGATLFPGAMARPRITSQPAHRGTVCCERVGLDSSRGVG